MVCIVKSFPVRKSADVSRHDFGRCCTDSTGDGETNLNSTQLFSCKVNQSSLYTGYQISGSCSYKIALVERECMLAAVFRDDLLAMNFEGLRKCRLKVHAPTNLSCIDSLLMRNFSTAVYLPLTQI